MKTTHLFVVFALFGLLLSGCVDSLYRGSGLVDSGGYSEGSGMYSPSAYDSGTASNGLSYETSSGDKIIKTGDIDVEVASGTLEQKYQDLKGLLEQDNAEVSSVSFTEYSDEKAYYLTVRVAPDNFDKLLEDVKTLGKVRSVGTNLDDVTLEYNDLTLRIQHKQVELQRLYGFYNMTDDVEQLLLVEEQITRVQYELESLQQQKVYYDNKIDLSTVTVRLFEQKSPIDAQLVDPLSNLFGVFLTALSIGLTLFVGFIGLVLPLVIVILIVKFLWGFFAKPSKKKKLTEV